MKAKIFADETEIAMISGGRTSLWFWITELSELCRDISELRRDNVLLTDFYREQLEEYFK